MKFVSFGITDIGRVRAVNEDRIHVNDKLSLYAVADGLGGLPGGALAADLTVRHLARLATPLLEGHAADYQSVFATINEIVYREGQRLYPNIGIGSTFTVVKLWQDTLFCGHVGDSAAYLVRRGMLCELTEEHTLAAELESRLGSELDEMPEYFYHTLTRCIGQKDKLEVYEHQCALEVGDRVLICSDGLTKVISQEDILNTIEANLTPEAAGRCLLEDALQAGAPDNVSIVIVYVVAS